MMATTHVLAGMAVASVTVLVAPDLAPVAVASAAVGGLFPDLDLYAGHRKTLHYPVYYSGAAAVALAVVAAYPRGVTAAIAFFLVGAAVHSRMDAFGGGLELKPWLGESDRAVYSHFHGRWTAPRRWIRYDGAPEDLALALALGIPPMVAFGSPIDEFVIGVIAVSALYALVRKPLVWIAEELVDSLPRRVLGYVPERFLDGMVE